MNERAASVIGFFIAFVVVFLVMNIHVLEEIIYDIRGITHPTKRSQIGVGSGSSPSLDFGGTTPIGTPTISGREGNTAIQGGVGIGGQKNREWFSNSATIDSKGRFSPVKTIQNRGEGVGQLAGGFSSDPSDGGSDGGTENLNMNDAELNEPPIPRIPEGEAPAIVVLVCKNDSQDPIMWFVGLTPDSIPLKVNSSMPFLLRESFKSLSSRPSKLGVAYYGCSESTLIKTKRMISKLCTTELSGVMVYDITTRRQLPMCGF